MLRKTTSTIFRTYVSKLSKIRIHDTRYIRNRYLLPTHTRKLHLMALLQFPYSCPVSFIQSMFSIHRAKLIKEFHRPLPMETLALSQAICAISHQIHINLSISIAFSLVFFFFLVNCCCCCCYIFGAQFNSISVRSKSHTKWIFRE